MAGLEELFGATKVQRSETLFGVVKIVVTRNSSENP